MSAHPLDQLASKLAFNHFHTSVSTLADDVLSGSALGGELPSRVFAKDHSGSGPERTILIVGSGASLATFGADEFPGPKEALDRIDRELGLTGEPMRRIAELVATRKSELADAYGYGEAFTDFETHLALLSDIFSQEAVSAELAKLYGERYRPHLVFELIAHMLKHRFIDVVINFNFDELLDQAIAGEMGTGEYHRIVSDGSCGKLEGYLVGDRLKVPLYIKPHGTVGQPTSMRFTKDHYHQLPPPLRKLMGDVVAGHSSRTDEDRVKAGYRRYPVNLITIGFGMKSLDLLALIRAALSEQAEGGPTKFTLFHIDRHEKKDEFERLAEREKWTFDRPFIAVEDHGQLTGTMQKLWEDTKVHFCEAFRPRGIARHEIVHDLFHAPGVDGGAGCRVPKKPGAYFEARLYVELAFALARGNGQIDLSAQSATRVGHYFGLMWDDGPKLAIHEILRRFTRDGVVAFTDPARTVFRIHWNEVKNAKAANDQLAEDLWGYLRAALGSIDDVDFRAHLASSRIHEDGTMIRRFGKLASSDAKDIDPSFQPSRLLLSRSPNADRVLHTSLGLTIQFIQMLNRPWELMLVVSELGKVVEKYLRHIDYENIREDPEKKKRFCMVVGRNDRPSIAKTRLDDLPGQLLGYGSETFFTLPPDAHTHHMVLLLARGEGGQLRPVSGISYRKSGIHSRVNPVYLERHASYDGSCPDDLDDALDCFKSYVHQSVVTTTGDQQLDREAVWKAVLAGMPTPGEHAAAATIPTENLQITEPDAEPTPR